MNERQVSEASAAWIGEVVGADAASIAAYPVATALGPSPLVAAVVDRKHTEEARAVENLFPLLQLEEYGFVRVFDIAASVLVGLEDQDEAAALAATQTLQGYGYDLEMSLFADDELGGRVPMASPFISFDYSQVYEELPDGFRGRLLVIAMTVGEVIDFDPK